MRKARVTILRHVDAHQNNRLTGYPLTKNAERRAKFQAIGKAISASKSNRIGDPNAHDYTTGRESSFELKRFDAKHREQETEDGKLCFWPRRRVEIPFGPRFNTPQFERTVRK